MLLKYYIFHCPIVLSEVNLSPFSLTIRKQLEIMVETIFTLVSIT